MKSEILTLDPCDFADPAYAERFSPAFTRYVELKVNGVPSEHACIQAFKMIANRIDMSNLSSLALALDTNPWVTARVEQGILNADPEDLWQSDGSHALHALLAMLKHPNVRDTVKLQAIDRLNLLRGIMKIGENGSILIDTALSDFDKLVKKQKSTDNGTKH
ncbi:hypothetical protein [Paraburkholderia hospita]|uniref:Uncharacterized protein n=1 Tax=Paraburkholderia hospita TaxID=169430 RepID=A0AAN1JIP8_9BURK|nr:hypothetical protein [Paraburkholderia hospita]AUT74043.1 hypothetical protein C2L64_37740 [Paraburkholderia hospita]EIN02953.1 hypothetical protein WQE_00985 [Paraburkholderia hospita]OUL78687.1 hypothetical protein CA602_31075 [Paraburkholderia hospita]OUL85892.1 hypothetical protein CA601_23070 [Paraburkholderia hospita]SEH45457.1 hypothetical protein SAMN05192544_100242 [Paraburkholderia hospita]